MFRPNRYFLAGSGGGMTRFGAPLSGNGWGAGERIIPLSKPEAWQWAEAFLPPEANPWSGTSPADLQSK